MARTGFSRPRKQQEQEEVRRKILTIELIGFTEYTRDITLNDVKYPNEKAWGNTKELDDEHTNALLKLLSEDTESGDQSTGKAPTGQDDGELSAVEGLLKERVVLARGRNAKLRREALKSAKGRCEVCETDFSLLLGGLGMRVLQVHHKFQLALAVVPKVTKLKDLAVVCANCHALIHANPKEATPVEKMHELMSGTANSVTA